MRFFCTLFDSGFFSRGRVLYESLEKCYQKEFHLYVLACDHIGDVLLKELELPHMTVISLVDFEDPELLIAKGTRSQTEYFWTCTPSVILYCINRFKLDMCTYLDADMMFFASPEPLFTEMGSASILITPHRYLPAYDQSRTSGIYCVQFMTFRRDNKGLNALRWWRNECLEWCYNRQEEGKFGDQKYLDDWPQRFEGVHVLHHLGGGVAPWNSDRYRFSVSQGKLLGFDPKTKTTFEVIFFHFHGLRFFASRTQIETMKRDYFWIQKCKVDLGHYPLSKACLKEIYTPYLRALAAIECYRRLDVHAIAPVQWTIKYFLRLAKRTLLGVCHYYQCTRFMP